MSGRTGFMIYGKIHATSYAKPFYAKFKKHNCIKCGNQLITSKITQYIEKNSTEAAYKSLRFPLFGPPIKYTFTIFECPKWATK